jgi:hypothetical protein
MKTCMLLLFICLLFIGIGCRSTDSYWTLPLTRNVDVGKSNRLEGVIGGFIGCFLIDICLLPITVAHDMWLYHKRHPEELPSAQRRNAINWYEKIMKKYERE